MSPLLPLQHRHSSAVPLLRQPRRRHLKSCIGGNIGVVVLLLFILTLPASLPAAAAAAAQAAVVDFEHPNATLTKLAFGSCHKNKYPNPEIWSSIAAEKADAWFWMGDAIYPPLRGISSVELMRKDYDHMLQNRSLGYSDFLTKLRSTTTTSGASVYGVIDDHDYGGNDMGKYMPDKFQRAAAFWDFLQLPAPDDGQRQGMYSSVSWGEAPTKVKAVFLDARWHRDNQCLPSAACHIPLGAGIACLTRWLEAGLLLNRIPGFCRRPATPTVLGEVQWQWLESQLKDSDAAVHVIVSGVQVLSTNPAMEGWGHFPEERERLIRLLQGVSGVVLLSGDVHYAELLSPVDRTTSSGSSSGSSTFLEITSSGLTHTCQKHLYGGLCKPILETFHKHRFADRKNYFIGKNYGTLQVDWTRQTVTTEIHDSAGSTVLTTGPRPFQQAVLTEEQIKGMAAVQDGHLLLPVFTAAAGLAVVLLVRKYWG